uniref:(California timema) hypothetical protein n=1 Tax=Timema californicum TaxID=61474 RepID=A0A7R9P749_TIMCA|nr:unnamed protein product [Timema californicum]
MLVLVIWNYGLMKEGWEGESTPTHSPDARALDPVYQHSGRMKVITCCRSVTSSLDRPVQASVDEKDMSSPLGKAAVRELPWDVKAPPINNDLSNGLLYDDISDDEEMFLRFSGGEDDDEETRVPVDGKGPPRSDIVPARDVKVCVDGQGDTKRTVCSDNDIKGHTSGERNLLCDDSGSDDVKISRSDDSNTHIPDKDAGLETMVAKPCGKLGNPQSSPPKINTCPHRWGASLAVQDAPGLVERLAMRGCPISVTSATLCARTRRGTQILASSLHYFRLALQYGNCQPRHNYLVLAGSFKTCRFADKQMSVGICDWDIAESGVADDDFSSTLSHVDTEGVTNNLVKSRAAVNNPRLAEHSTSGESRNTEQCHNFLESCVQKKENRLKSCEMTIFDGPNKESCALGTYVDHDTLEVRPTDKMIVYNEKEGNIEANQDKAKSFGEDGVKVDAEKCISNFSNVEKTKGPMETKWEGCIPPPSTAGPLEGGTLNQSETQPETQPSEETTLNQSETQPSEETSEHSLNEPMETDKAELPSYGEVTESSGIEACLERTEANSLIKIPVQNSENCENIEVPGNNRVEFPNKNKLCDMECESMNDCEELLKSTQTDVFCEPNGFEGRNESEIKKEIHFLNNFDKVEAAKQIDADASNDSGSLLEHEADLATKAHLSGQSDPLPLNCTDGTVQQKESMASWKGVECEGAKHEERDLDNTRTQKVLSSECHHDNKDDGNVVNINMVENINILEVESKSNLSREAVSCQVDAAVPRPEETIFAHGGGEEELGGLSRGAALDLEEENLSRKRCSPTTKVVSDPKRLKLEDEDLCRVKNHPGVEEREHVHEVELGIPLPKRRKTTEDDFIMVFKEETCPDSQVQEETACKNNAPTPAARDVETLSGAGLDKCFALDGGKQSSLVDGEQVATSGIFLVDKEQSLTSLDNDKYMTTLDKGESLFEESKLPSLPVVDEREGVSFVDKEDILPALDKNKCITDSEEGSSTVSYEKCLPLLNKKESLLILNEVEGLPLGGETEESLPVAGKEESLLVLHKEESYPVVNKKESLLVLNQGSNLSVMNKKKSFLVLNQKEGLLVVDKEESFAVVDKEERLIVADKEESLPVVNKEESLPVLNKEESLSVVNKEESLPVLNKEESLPVLNKEESLPVLNKEESLSVVNKEESLLVLDQVKCLPIVDEGESLMVLGPKESLSVEEKAESLLVGDKEEKVPVGDEEESLHVVDDGESWSFGNKEEHLPVIGKEENLLAPKEPSLPVLNKGESWSTIEKSFLVADKKKSLLAVGKEESLLVGNDYHSQPTSKENLSSGGAGEMLPVCNEDILLATYKEDNSNGDVNEVLDTTIRVKEDILSIIKQDKLPSTDKHECLPSVEEDILLSASNDENICAAVVDASLPAVIKEGTIFDVDMDQTISAVDKDSLLAVDIASSPAIDIASSPAIDIASSPAIDIASSPAINKGGSIPAIDKESLPAIDKESLPAIDIASSPAIDKGGSIPAIDKKSLPAIDKESLPAVDKGGSIPAIDKESLPAVDKASLPAVDEASIPAVDKRGSIPAIDKESLPVIDKASIPAVDKGGSIPTIDKESLPAVDKARIPAVDKESLPTVDKESLPTADKEILPAVDKASLPSVDKANLPAVNKESLPAVDKESLPAVDKESLPIVDKESLPTIDKESLLCTDKVSLLGVDKESLLGTDKESLLCTDKESLLGTDKESIPATYKENLPALSQVEAADNSTLTASEANEDSLHAMLHDEDSLLASDEEDTVTTRNRFALKVKGSIFGKIKESEVKLTRGEFSSDEDSFGGFPEELLLSADDLSDKDESTSFSADKNKSMSLLANKIESPVSAEKGKINSSLKGKEENLPGDTDDTLSASEGKNETGLSSDDSSSKSTERPLDGDKRPATKGPSKGKDSGLLGKRRLESLRPEIIKVKKVRISPEVEKQLKNQAEKDALRKKEPAHSLPAKTPITNLDFAIERVVSKAAVAAPGISDEERSIIMSYMKAFHKVTMSKMTRDDLEEMVMQKMCELIAHRSELGQNRQKIQSLELLNDQLRRKSLQLQKQAKDLHTVTQRLVNELRTRKDGKMTPVRLTRSVGLQVQVQTQPMAAYRGPGPELGPHGFISGGRVRKPPPTTTSPPSAPPTIPISVSTKSLVGAVEEICGRTSDEELVEGDTTVGPKGERWRVTTKHSEGVVQITSDDTGKDNKKENERNSTGLGDRETCFRIRTLKETVKAYNEADDKLEHYILVLGNARREVPLKCKKVLRPYFVPIVTHVAKTWTLNVNKTTRAEAMGVKFVRSLIMLAVTRRNKIRNVIRERVGEQVAHEKVEEGKLRCYGYVWDVDGNEKNTKEMNHVEKKTAMSNNKDMLKEHITPLTSSAQLARKLAVPPQSRVLPSTPTAGTTTTFVATTRVSVIAPPVPPSVKVSQPPVKVCSLSSPVKTPNRPSMSSGGPPTVRVQPMMLQNPPRLSPIKPAKDTSFIDLTDEEDKGRSSSASVRLVGSLPSSATVTSSSPLGGSIRVVQPHQLTGTTATLLTSTASGVGGQRLAYLLPTSSSAPGQSRQVYITSSTPSSLASAATVTQTHNGRTIQGGKKLTPNSGGGERGKKRGFALWIQKDKDL